MESAENEIAIKVTIGDRVYPLTIQSDEEEVLRKAAKLINEKAKFYQSNFSVKDKQDALALAALEFASEMLGNEHNEDSNTLQLERKISYFQQILDNAMH
ncbi:MAG: cell division protein ZapA [Flavobacteriales bacterium]|nr:cell division protein ZapA [Flavobacteriales bacterium]